MLEQTPLSVHYGFVYDRNEKEEAPAANPANGGNFWATFGFSAEVLRFLISFPILSVDLTHAIVGLGQATRPWRIHSRAALSRGRSLQ